METQPNVQSPVRIWIFGTSAQNLGKSKYQSLAVLSNFIWSSYFWQNIFFPSCSCSTVSIKLFDSLSFLNTQSKAYCQSILLFVSHFCFILFCWTPSFSCLPSYPSILTIDPIRSSLTFKYRFWINFFLICSRVIKHSYCLILTILDYYVANQKSW